MGSINTELTKVFNWFHINKLCLNSEKSTFINFCSKRRITNMQLTININGIEIKQSTSTKFLGVTIDHHLEWKAYAEILKQKLAKNINIINHIKKFLNKSALHTLYFALIHSHITYCNLIWGHNYKNITEKIQIMQNKAIRLTFNMGNNYKTQHLYLKYHILNIVNLNKYQTALFIYKYVNKLLPTFFYINKYFTLNYDIHKHMTRSNNNLHLSYAKTNKRLFTIKHYGPCIWNGIPDQLKSINNFIIFKSTIKSFLLNNDL